MSDPVDLTLLHEAVDEIDEYRRRFPETATPIMDETVAAARSVVEGAEIRWCTEHKAEGIGGDLPYCWHGYYLEGDPAIGTVRCQVVSRILVEPLDP